MTGPYPPHHPRLEPVSSFLSRANIADAGLTVTWRRTLDDCDCLMNPHHRWNCARAHPSGRKPSGSWTATRGPSYAHETSQWCPSESGRRAATSAPAATRGHPCRHDCHVCWDQLSAQIPAQPDTEPEDNK